MDEYRQMRLRVVVAGSLITLLLALSGCAALGCGGQAGNGGGFGGCSVGARF
jgi:hypothetical protein